MTAHAAITGDYTDLRFIKGRKVCQITIEIPIEAGESFVKAFGTPNPATGVPVAIARLDPNAKPEKKGGKLAQRAGILCNEGAFQKFVGEQIGKMSGAYHSQSLINSDDVADYIKWYCGVASRAYLDHNEEAARKFLDMEASYKAWLTVPA